MCFWNAFQILLWLLWRCSLICMNNLAGNFLLTRLASTKFGWNFCSLVNWTLKRRSLAIQKCSWWKIRGWKQIIGVKSVKWENNCFLWRHMENLFYSQIILSLVPPPIYLSSLFIHTILLSRCLIDFFHSDEGLGQGYKFVNI